MKYSTHTTRLILFAFLFCAIYSCTEQNLTTNPKLSSNTTATDAVTNSVSVSSLFHKKVGAPIDKQLGLGWIKNFAKNKPANANAEYFLKAEALKGILAAHTCVGISLFYAFDATGHLIILPIGIDNNGKAISTQYVPANPTLDWNEAWKYINEHTGKVKAHFFGSETFKRLLVDQNATEVRVSLALDDAGGSQLLMSNASVANPSSYEDMSTPCPPVCSTN